VSSEARILDMLKTGLGAYLSVEAKRIADIVGKQEEIIRKVIGKDIIGLPYTYNLDDVFIGLKALPGRQLGIVIPGSIEPASKYWTTNGLKCPLDAMEISVWSRRTFKYPKVAVVAKLPPPEVGALYYPISLFNMAYSEFGGPIEFHSYGGSNYAILAAGCWRYWDYTYPVAVVQNILPTDYNTAYHTYMMKVNKWGVEFFIDGRLRGVLIATQTELRYRLDNALPYSIGVGYAVLNSEFAFGIRIGNVSENPADWKERLIQISPHYVAIGDGDPCPPKALHLYVSGSDNRLANQSISSGSITSHPIPVFGYSKKTIYFMASQSGTLEIQTFTLSNKWRTYDSISIPANTFYAYKMTGDAVLARVVFTPSTYPATINEAEVVLNE